MISHSFREPKNCFTSVQRLCIKLSMLTTCMYSTSIFSFSVQEPEHSSDGDDHQNLTNLTVTLPTTTLF